MAYLPLANIMHHKLRSLLSAFGIGIGICMLITLTGLSRGSLYEVADRMNSVDADAIIVPSGLASKTPTMSGIVLSEKIAGIVQKRYPDTVAQAVPVCIGSLKLGGQDQRVTGIDPANWKMLAGDRKLKGRLFDPNGKFAAWIEKQMLAPADDSDEIVDLSALLKKRDNQGLEIVIDSRLAQAGKYSVGQEVEAGNHKWKIVGIVPAGVTTRVFMPLRTAQFLFGFGDITKCTMIFVKFKPGQDTGPASKMMQEQLGLDVLPLDHYKTMLTNKFGIMFTYVDAVNVIALLIAFLFVMTTLYMMVLQQTREIAILKSCGASGWYILRQVVGEALILTTFGTVMGIAMSFGAAWAIQTFKPLLTVQLSVEWILWAIGAALGGAMISAIYPAWRASRVDMVEALTYE